MRDDERDDDRRRRRDNIMQQRLRRARGEEIEEDLEPVAPYDDDDRPRGLPRYSPGPRYTLGGGGCATSILYLVIGVVATLLIVGFYLNQTLGGVGRLFESVPDVAAMLDTPTPAIISGDAVIRQIRELSRLETAAYTIERVIDVRQGSNIPVVGDFLAGDELLLIAHGFVVAGVDLATLQSDAVTVSPDGSTITLRLPPVQVFQASLDSQKTRVYSRDRGLFAPDNKDLETLARQAAEQQILQAACEDGIMQKATEEAGNSLRQFLGLLDFSEVVVVTAEPGACAAPSIPVSPAPAPGATPVTP